MWDNMEAWKTWTNSEIRKANVAELKDNLIGEAEYEHYSLGLALE
jgi:heme-degrading monooxygenase HmoA